MKGHSCSWNRHLFVNHAWRNFFHQAFLQGNSILSSKKYYLPPAQSLSRVWRNKCLQFDVKITVKLHTYTVSKFKIGLHRSGHSVDTFKKEHLKRNWKWKEETTRKWSCQLSQSVLGILVQPLQSKQVWSQTHFVSGWPWPRRRSSWKAQKCVFTGWT